MSRLAAPLAFLLLTAACGGGGGDPAPQHPKALPGTFVAPRTPLTLPMGGTFAVHVTGLPPGAPVVVAFDTDGNPATKGDNFPLVGTGASATGELEASISTEGLPAGDYRLLVVRSGASAEVLAITTAPVSLAPGGRLVWLGSSAAEFVTLVQPLADGRVALAGTYSGEPTYATGNGPVTLPETPFQDAFTAVLDGTALVGVSAIGGQYYENLLDLAASPTGTFAVAGMSQFSLPDFGGPPVSTPSTSWEGQSAGFAGTYNRDGHYVRGLISWGHSVPGVGAHNVECWAVAYAPDGARWLALRAQSNFQVGGQDLARPGTAGGCVIVRLDDQNQAAPPFVTIEGAAEVTAMRFEGPDRMVVAGTGTGVVQFRSLAPVDLGPGSAFVARFDAGGECIGLLTRNFGTGSTTGNDLALGADGTLYLVGSAYGLSTLGSMPIDVGTSGFSGYVLAVAPDLTPLWLRTWMSWVAPGGPNFAQAVCTGVAALPDGGCAVVGSAYPGVVIGNVTVGDGVSDRGGAVARYGSGGDLVWVVAVGGEGPQVLESVAVDAEGCVLVPGGCFGPLHLTDRDGTTVHPSVNATGFDGFLLRLDPDGLVR